MNEKTLLDGKRVLIVDDEPDVLDSLEELLSMCDVSRATSFEAAKALLETKPFDLAVLDIMGVQGYKLLDLALVRGELRWIAFLYQWNTSMGRPSNSIWRTGSQDGH